MVLDIIMSVDYISGMVSTWIMGELSSCVDIMGIVKKAAYLLAVVAAIAADWIVQTAAGKIGVDFGGFYFFGLLVTIWLILNECISILENVSEIGVPRNANGKIFTPEDACNWSMECSYKALNQGTYYSYFRPQFAAFGIDCDMLNWTPTYGKLNHENHDRALDLLKQGY